MGIYDRDYVGADRPGRAPIGFGGGLGAGRGLGSPRFWSGNAWLIAICISVFVLDGLLYAGANIALRVDMGTAFVEGVTEAQKERAVVRQATSGARPARSMPGGRADPIIDPQTNQVIGEARYQIMYPLRGLGHFSTGKGFLGLEVWRLVSFQFLHANLMHLLFNMLGLFFFGSIVEQHLGKRLYLAFYLVCGIFGAVMYLLLNLLGQTNLTIPGVLVGDVYTPLIGASAGVFGVLMAAARLSPNTSVLFMFIIPMRLSTLIYMLVGIAAITLITRGPNAGGEAAHLGGAIAGWFFIRNAHLLSDFFEILGPPEARSRRRASPSPRRRSTRERTRRDDEAMLDRILAKVANEGMDSLSRKERKFLEKASASKRD